MSGKPTVVDRLHRFFSAGGPREAIQVRIVRDERDKPPWTVELLVDRRTLVVRAGATLQSALTAALDAPRDAVSAPLPRPGIGDARESLRAS